MVIHLSSTVSFKVPTELKEKMRKYEQRIKWSKELREFVRRKIQEIEKEEALEIARNIISQTKGVPDGFSAKAVREDRDSH